MKKDDLNPGTFTNAMGMLQGKVAGLQIINPVSYTHLAPATESRTNLQLSENN